MDKNKKLIIDKKILKAIENLNKNNMMAFYVETAKETKNKVCELLSEGDTVSCGGSVTLKETGIIDLLDNGCYDFLDRSKANSKDEANEIARKALTCDVYLSSANAITTDGVIYNVDGLSNRVAAILFGPKSVIIVAGYNKIVGNLDDAVKRVKTIAAPANSVRLGCDTYCNPIGKCMSVKNTNFLSDGCRNDGRICANYVISAKQQVKNRIKVIIVGEELGY